MSAPGQASIDDHQKPAPFRRGLLDKAVGDNGLIYLGRGWLHAGSLGSRRLLSER
jgi:hypothetical protein